MTKMGYKFNEDSRVKIPALLHLTRLGYTFLPKSKMTNIHPDTNIFLNEFKEGISKINGKEYSDSEIWAYVNEINIQLENASIQRELKKRPFLCRDLPGCTSSFFNLKPKTVYPTLLINQ